MSFQLARINQARCHKRSHLARRHHACDVGRQCSAWDDGNEAAILSASRKKNDLARRSAQSALARQRYSSSHITNAPEGARWSGTQKVWESEAPPLAGMAEGLGQRQRWLCLPCSSILAEDNAHGHILARGEERRMLAALAAII